MKNYWKIVQSEFRERVFSSKKRVIKFVAICFVPFLYAFICIWAFWNPIPNIGLAPIGIISNDRQVNLVAGKIDGILPVEGIGVAKSYTLKDDQNKEYEIGTDKFDFSNPNIAKIITTNGTTIIKDESFSSSYFSILDIVMNAWKTNDIPGISFNEKTNKFSFKASDDVSLTNVEYVSGAEADKIATQNESGVWKTHNTEKYWVQIQIPQNFSQNFFNIFDYISGKLEFKNAANLSSLKDLLNEFAKSPINLWSTYRNNFIFGQFIYLFDTFKTSTLVEGGPELVIATLEKVLSQAPQSNTLLVQLIEKVVKLGIDLIKDIDQNSPDFTKFVNTDIEGINNNLYGIGLGQFFLCIGAWVGVLMQTFIYDRKKRVQSASNISFYFGKLTLMIATSMIQITILMISVLGLGFHVIGPYFGVLYLWMLFTTVIFTIIINALWFSFRDQTVGKFLCVIFLVINLSSGWGTFPTFMQAKIFEVLSYIAPYTYSIHGQGAIIYGLAVNGQNLTDNLIILANMGYLLIFGVVFGLMGAFFASQRHREMKFSTASTKKMIVILKQLELDKYIIKNNKVNWRDLENENTALIYQAVDEKFPEEKYFKSYEKWKNKEKLTNSEIEIPGQASASDDE